jgi:hypothetical protein
MRIMRASIFVSVVVVMLIAIYGCAVRNAPDEPRLIIEIMLLGALPQNSQSDRGFGANAGSAPKVVSIPNS